MEHDARFPAPAAPAGEATGTSRLLGVPLPRGWSVIGRCRQGAAPPADGPTGCHVLAHPDIGIALLDLAPDVTPNAEARLRRLLAASGFRDLFPGTLPVWHTRLEPAQLRRLPWLLEEAFASLAPLTLTGGGAWPVAVREALDADPAWQAAGRERQTAPRAKAPLPAMAWEGPARRDHGILRGVARGVLLGLGFCTVFLLGVAAGLQLGFWPVEDDPPEMAGPAPAPLPPREAPAAPFILPVAPEAGPSGTALPPAPAVGPAAIAGEGPAGNGWQWPAMAPDAAALGADRGDGIPAAEATPPEDPSIAEAVPPPPEAMPPPPARPAPRRGLTYDRRCLDAMFRWQQGERLSAAEMAYLREGCATTGR
ncbi:hypothetical protein [Crenalkalicoccus roseus]|uniref:hypothetical protein n=1 Tax=Crenalkalicoccus roseus TaxID=1485588 RepID=UPI0010811EBC|nr:hypothetical protein [Crenalkalicoccus roseus]